MPVIRYGQPPFASFYHPDRPDAPVMHAKAHLMASLSLEPTTMLWGYASMFADRRDLSPVPMQIFQFGRQMQLEAFNTEAFYYADPATPDSDRLAARTDAFRYLGGVAAEILGPGYVPMWVSTSEVSGFVVLVSDFLPPDFTVIFDDVLTFLADVLVDAAMRRYDALVGIRGLAKHLGWQLSEQATDTFGLIPPEGPEYLGRATHYPAKPAKEVMQPLFSAMGRRFVIHSIG
ncbi:DUF6882 domain-containing protein [Corynebacterium hindlerae]|uniref:DUF6882 domain-containing protein n=1 Tax=Corynebacterium hindlerae TaxID=699041 RepID=UPI0031B6780E